MNPIGYEIHINLEKEIPARFLQLKETYLLKLFKVTKNLFLIMTVHLSKIIV